MRNPCNINVQNVTEKPRYHSKKKKKEKKCGRPVFFLVLSASGVTSRAGR